MPILAALKMWLGNFNYILSTAVIICQEHIMINYMYILLIHLNVYFCILHNTLRYENAWWCDLWWCICIVVMNMRCFYCFHIALANQMPRKHLWLSVPSVIFDMLHIYWEGRTVNQTTIAQCPSVKAKGWKVHEKSNLCYNSTSVICTSPLIFACVSVR